MTTVAQLVDAARSELGYAETPVNLTKFAAEAHHTNGLAWCATFEVALANRVGLVLPAGCDTASVYQNLAGWQRAGKSPASPLPGDFVHFRIGQGHTGICVAADAGTVTTIDGNTIPDGMTGDEANGGMVALKTRPRSLVAGYGRPDYETASPSIGDLFMDLGPRATARLIHFLAWHHEPNVTDLDAAHYLLGTATTDEAKDNVVGIILDKESQLTG